MPTNPGRKWKCFGRGKKIGEVMAVSPPERYYVAKDIGIDEYPDPANASVPREDYLLESVDPVKGKAFYVKVGEV